MTKSPVVVILFNRPQWAARVFERIRLAKPEKLFVIADGPRPGHAEDQALIRESLALTDTVDWPCEIIKHVAESNMGCGRRIASGLSWVFEQVDRAIVLEDDCLPDPSFFPFCDELLERFKDNDRVMSILGTNFADYWPNPNSYFFSRQFSSLGWASWARAWQNFD